MRIYKIMGYMIYSQATSKASPAARISHLRHHMRSDSANWAIRHSIGPVVQERNTKRFELHYAQPPSYSTETSTPIGTSISLNFTRAPTLTPIYVVSGDARKVTPR